MSKQLKIRSGWKSVARQISMQQSIADIKLLRKELKIIIKERESNNES